MALRIEQRGDRDWIVYEGTDYLGTITRFEGGTPSYGAGVIAYTTSIEPGYISHASFEDALAVFIGPNPKAKAALPFLQGHQVNGTINAQGEERDDVWRIVVTDSIVKTEIGTVEITYR